MENTIELWITIGLYILAALLASITIQLIRPLKAKILILCICLLSSILSLRVAYNTFLHPPSLQLTQIKWPTISFDLISLSPWNYLSIALSIGGGLTLFLIHRQNFQKASVLCLIELALLHSLLFCHQAVTFTVIAIASGLLINIPFCLNEQSDKQTLISILLWQRLSDLLLLLSIAAFFIGTPVAWHASLFLTGIWLRTSSLIATTSRHLVFASTSPAILIFYFFSTGMGSAILLFKSSFFFLIPAGIKNIFILLYLLSALFSALWIFICKDRLFIRLHIAFFYISLIHIAALTSHQNIMIALLFGSFLFFPVLLHEKQDSNHPVGEEKIQWKLFVLSGWRIDSLIETIFLKLIGYLAYFAKKIITPTIEIVWIKIPQACAVFILIILRILNAGGIQKAVTVVILGLTLFLIYYVGI